MARRLSQSSGQKISLFRKLDEWKRQWKILKTTRGGGFSHLALARRAQIQEYTEVMHLFGSCDLSRARIFEIGCGQRPYRLMNLHAAGADVSGVDMDVVLLTMTAARAIRVWRENGAERFLKTVVRHLMFDKEENRQLEAFLEGQGTGSLHEIESRISQGNAADLEVWPRGSLDFIYSEDVFEHISPEDLPRVCENMVEKLGPEGIALIRPMIFTGIKGGHNVEWYSAERERKRNCPPWDHLLERSYPSNTYLNRLWLAEYRELFSKYFEIIDETVEEPSAGAWALTNDLREKLSEYPDEELFSNRVRFILKKKDGR